MAEATGRSPQVQVGTGRSESQPARQPDGLLADLRRGPRQPVPDIDRRIRSPRPLDLVAIVRLTLGCTRPRLWVSPRSRSRRSGGWPGRRRGHSCCSAV